MRCTTLTFVSWDWKNPRENTVNGPWFDVINSWTTTIDRTSSFPKKCLLPHCHRQYLRDNSRSACNWGEVQATKSILPTGPSRCWRGFVRPEYYVAHKVIDERLALGFRKSKQFDHVSFTTHTCLYGLRLIHKYICSFTALPARPDPSTRKATRGGPRRLRSLRVCD